MIYFSSDIHFDHRNILAHCNRPYPNIEVMNEAIINNFNKRLKTEDILYILGDFTLGVNLKRVFDLFTAIKCNDIRVIPGNHDAGWIKKYRKEVERYDNLNSSHILCPTMKILKDIEILKYNEYVFTLCHYPIERWYQTHRDNSFHLHGHSHNTSRVMPKRWDVGVDANNFQLISIVEAIGKCKIQEEK